MFDYLDQAMRDAGRIELRHHDGDRWVSGLFDDLGALRAAIRARADRGNLYTTINAPRLMAASNAMHDAALVDADIVMCTRLPFDFDPIRPRGTPSTDDELRAAVAARDRMVATLHGEGWPQPATAISGNGAHALYRVRMRVSPEWSEMLRALYAGLKTDFSTEAVDFDTTVRNAARIWRLYGTCNRKGTPSGERPHRPAQVSIPARWDAVSPQQVERTAAMYSRKPKPAAAPRTAGPRIDGEGDYRTLDVVGWFDAHDAYRRHISGDKYAVACPWEADHSNESGPFDTSTVVWEARGALWPSFHCSHAHCEGRNVRDVLALWGDADRFCRRAWRTS